MTEEMKIYSDSKISDLLKTMDEEASVSRYLPRLRQVHFPEKASSSARLTAPLEDRPDWLHDLIQLLWRTYSCTHLRFL